MKNDLLITELKYEMKHFVDFLLKKHKGIMIDYNIYDEKEFFNDTKKGKE